jgi:hypothetical protein
MSEKRNITEAPAESNADENQSAEDFAGIVTSNGREIGQFIDYRGYEIKIMEYDNLIWTITSDVSTDPPKVLTVT